MILKNVLLISTSVVYQKLVKIAIAELEPQATVYTRNGADIHAINPELLIVDTALKDADVFAMTNRLSKEHPHSQIVLLCDKKMLDRKNEFNVPDHLLSLIFKPLEEDYESNLKTVKRGIRLAIIKLKREEEESLPKVKQRQWKSHDYSLLLIAASTGGPNAISEVLSNLRKTIGVPVMIVQHMPPGFTKNFAYNLNRQTELTVCEANVGDSPQSGNVYIAPGGFHLKVNESRQFLLEESEYVNGVRPSADVLFYSIAQHFRGEKILAVVLTGMGSDGEQGIRALKESCNCRCIAQNEPTCTVFGMPRAVIAANLADEVLPLGEIGNRISEILQGSQGGKKGGIGLGSNG